MRRGRFLAIAAAAVAAPALPTPALAQYTGTIEWITVLAEVTVDNTTSEILERWAIIKAAAFGLPREALGL